MPIWSRILLGRHRPAEALTAAAVVLTQSQAGEDSTGRRQVITAQEWQREVWGFYDSLGAFRNAVTWKSDMLSRVRLRAARKEPGKDEPTILDNGPAADIVAELSASTQSQIMSGFAVHLTVPGEGYLVGETQADGKNLWQARSTDEVRYRPSAKSRNGLESPYQVIDENTVSGAAATWRTLSKDSMVTRLWRGHRRYMNVADSNARAARNSMRELELVNRHIVSQYLNRLASAGVILFPSEVSFPENPAFADSPDPFVAEWIDNAAQAIATPGSALAAVPFPMRIPGEYLDKVQHIDFTLKMDAHLVLKRDSAQKQLATDLDVPPETLLGMSDANHWTGWLIEESAFKVYLAPDTELICGGLTSGYLTPRLLAAGESADDLVVWYDASEIIQRPDKSDNTKDAYDRGEASGKALRRELGLDEDDRPSDDELGRQILYALALQAATAPAALKQLLGIELDVPAPVAVDVPTDGGPAPSGGPNEGQQNGPPEQTAPPPKGDAPKDAKQKAESSLLNLAGLQHAIRLSLISGDIVLHPVECADHLGSCPVNQAVHIRPGLKSRPGGSGVYQLWLNAGGAPVIGREMMDSDVSNMRPTFSDVER